VVCTAAFSDQFIMSPLSVAVVLLMISHSLSTAGESLLHKLFTKGR